MAISMPNPSLRLPRRTSGNSVPRSQAERLWLIGGSIVAAALMLLGYVLLISPQRSSTDNVDAQLGSARTQNSALQSRLSALKAESANAAKYMTQLAAARAALPSSSGISDFVRSLQAIGNATGTSVTAVTVGSPTAVVAQPPKPAPGATSPAPAPAAPAASAAAAAATVYSMAITGQVSGSAKGLDAFLQQLQAVQPRAVLVTSITEAAAGAPGSAGGAKVAPGGTTLSLVMQAFVAPNLAAAPTAPGASPTPAP